MLQTQAVHVFGHTPAIGCKITQYNQRSIRVDLAIIISGCSELAVAQLLYDWQYLGVEDNFIAEQAIKLYHIV